MWKGQISYKQREKRERERERERERDGHSSGNASGRGRSPKKRGHLRGSAYEKAGQVSKKTWPFGPKLVSKGAGVKKKMEAIEPKRV